MGEEVDGSSSPPSPVGEPDPSARFAEEAQAAGIVLPKPTRPNPWFSVVVIAVVIASAMGIGVLTGWTDLRGSNSAGLPALYGPQNCGATPIDLYGSTDPMLDAGFQTWLTSNASRIVNATGGCIHLLLNTSSAAGPGAELPARTVEFATASSAPNASEVAGFPAPVVFYPLALSAVAVEYNLPGVASGLNLTAGVLAGIYSGAITSWDAPSIVALNPEAHLAGLPNISVVYRADPSLGTAVFSDYLASGNATWAERYGSGVSISWPVGWSALGSAALLDHVASTPGAIGYVELMSQPLAGTSLARLQNPDGAFVSPDPTNVSDAASADGNLTAVVSREWANVSLVDAPGASSYPLATLTYLGLYRDLGVAYAGTVTLTNATWLMTLLWWLSESTAFAPLPSSFAAESQSAMTNVTYDGHPILQVQESEGSESGGETGEF